VDDLHIPGALVVKALRSRVDKGKIRRIDTSAAARLAGVADVITHEDVPNNAFGVIPDRPVLAETIRYKGEPIAAVAAEDEKTALRALDQIKVEIDEEEPVFDPFEAMQPGAPKVRPEGNCYRFGDKPFRRVVLGDIEAGFQQADLIVEGQYRTNPVEHTPLETQVGLAVPETNGKLTIHTACQSPLSHLSQLAAILQMDEGDVRLTRWAGRVRKNWKGTAGISIKNGPVGGGFGGKSELHTDHITALLALRTGRPVKWRWTRKEELLYSTHRGSWHVSIRDGVMRDGRIVARRVKTVRDAGAYSALNIYVVDKHCFNVSGPYSIPNIYVEGYCVYTNRPPASSMRGFGVMPATFAGEVQMNRIASRLDMDPWELRFINAYRNGDQTATRCVLDSVYLIETMQACARKAGKKLPDELMAMTSAPREKQI
jgi:CO/xanthine dehydrogenase Mo-binding subunit